MEGTNGTGTEQPFIKQNYELFKEINDRTTRQDTQ
jgi:hypothetical protein